jgi:hypothetical protein
MLQPNQMTNTRFQGIKVNEIHRQIQLPQKLTRPQPFHHANVIQSHIQVFQALQMMQLLKTRQQIVLQIQNLELSARAAQDVVDPLELFLVQGQFFQTGEKAFVVLGPLAQQGPSDVRHGLKSTCCLCGGSGGGGQTKRCRCLFSWRGSI